MKTVATLLGFATILTLASGQSVVVNHTTQDSVSSPYDNAYNRSTQVTITGKIIGIGVSRPSPQMSHNMRLLVQSLGKPRTTSLVELGPQWFVRSQTVHPKLGQWVRITGSKIRDLGENKILASQVTLHDHSVLALRRSTGLPYWVSLTPPTTQEPLAQDLYGPDPGRLAAQGTILSAQTFRINGVDYAGYVVQTSTGPTNVIVAPPDFGPSLSSFMVGDNLRVFSGGYFSPSVVLNGGQALPGPYILGSTIIADSGAMFVGPSPQSFPGFTRW